MGPKQHLHASLGTRNIEGVDVDFEGHDTCVRRKGQLHATLRAHPINNLLRIRDARQKKV
jgi:hypothetical protein